MNQKKPKDTYNSLKIGYVNDYNSEINVSNEIQKYQNSKKSY